MLWFSFDVPGGDLGYQVKSEVHVIGSGASELRLTFRGKHEVVVKKLPVVEKEKKVVVIYFDFDSAKLGEGEKKKLEKVKGKVFLRGYASPEGPSSYNLNLSIRRAKSVATFLEKRGVKVLGLRGFGEEGCKEAPSRWYLCRKVEVERK